MGQHRDGRRRLTGGGRSDGGGADHCYGPTMVQGLFGFTDEEPFAGAASGKLYEFQQLDAMWPVWFRAAPPSPHSAKLKPDQSV